VFAEMEGWRREHPKATFGEIEAAVEARLDSVRAELIEQEIALRAQVSAEDRSRRPTCPQCGKLMEARGTRERSVTVQGNHPVRLRRQYLVCAACGTGHFPPG
jgi:hypothetical protein